MVETKTIGKLKCPSCGSEHVTKAGWKITRTMGKRQRYQCQSCGRTFYAFAEAEEK